MKGSHSAWHVALKEYCLLLSWIGSPGWDSLIQKDFALLPVEEVAASVRTVCSPAVNAYEEWNRARDALLGFRRAQPEAESKDPCDWRSFSWAIIF